MSKSVQMPHFCQTPVSSSAFSYSHSSDVYEMDCIHGMKEYPDKYFDLAVVDPPYGININHSMGRRKGDKKSDYKKADWDNEPPPIEYFYELFRVSKNQIVWGQITLLVVCLMIVVVGLCGTKNLAMKFRLLNMKWLGLH